MRLVHAAAELACDEGLAALSATRVARLAGVPVHDFDAVFGSVERCVAAGRQVALERAASAARIAASGDPAERPASALDGLLEFAEQEQELAGLCVEIALRRGAVRVDGQDGEALHPPLALVGRALGALAAEPDLGARLAVRAGLSSVAQAGRLTVRLADLGLLDESLCVTERGAALAAA